MSVDQVECDPLFVYQAGIDLMTRKLLQPFAPEGRFRGHKSKAARKVRRDELLRVKKRSVHE